MSSPRNPARYCGPACRQAVRNVQDRERKWLSRGTSDGRKKRAIEYQAARSAASFDQATSPTRHHRDHLPNDGPPQAVPVVTYRVAIRRAGLLEPVVFPQEFQHACDTHPRPRATAASPPDRLVLG